MIQGDHFNLASVPKAQFQLFLKLSFKSNLSGSFLKDGVKFLSKPISYLRYLSITFGKFPDFSS